MVVHMGALEYCTLGGSLGAFWWCILIMHMGGHFGVGPLSAVLWFGHLR